MVASMFTAAADALAQAVVALRKRAGMTQRELAAALGREQNLVARIEQGQRRVDMIEWVQVCRACGADPEAEMVTLLRQVTPLVARRARKR
jgi:transcriptional regulator with XRE-family HTH domain